ncbi:MAG: TAT-variant-translocated molybdopterin oxidoreductase [Dyella sp.]|uniref:TAT-variant-translocated molybdopterin oxidoreductase n=1 Tax=Dyella sp. TaxID=1869338 RepID=UPI003F7F70BD
MTAPNDALRLASERLGARRGRHYWRALEELADDAQFRDQLSAALPQLATMAPLDRRGFLKLLGASLALAGLGGCSGPPPEKIVPWVRRPAAQSDAVRFYASALCCGGEVTGVLVETHDGRPTKIEGNPQHPASLGATGRLPQAQVLELWDPDRSSHPLHGDEPSTLGAFADALAQWRAQWGTRGDGLRILSGALHSPTLRAQRRELLARFPAAQWHVHEPAGDAQTLAGAQLAFGRRCRARYDVAAADVLLTLDADLLDAMPGHLAHARAFAARRRPDRAGQGAGMNRLYAIEPTPTVTGSVADHRWPLSSAQIAAVAGQLADALGVAGAPSLPADTGAPLPVAALHAVVDDLMRHRGRSLVVVGETQPPAVHALVHAINQALGNVGHTVDYIDPHGDADAPAMPDLAALVEAMQAGQVSHLLVLESNPAYTAPADVPFATALERVPHTMHLGLYRDETARACRWHLPAAHALEAWSDARAFDGTASVVQPVLTPLYDGWSAHELVARVIGAGPQDGHDIVRGYWAGESGGRALASDEAWERALREGVIEGTRAAALNVRASVSSLSPDEWRATDSDALELLLRPDPTIWDGRYANNGWLQELPKPPTQLTWSNAALISPQLAAHHGYANGDVARLRSGERELEVPVWITPGQATHSITLHLGHGRRHAGRVGDGIGVDAYRLRTAQRPWRAGALTMAPTGARQELAATQAHFAMEGRDLVRSATLDEFASDPAFAQAATPPTLYPPQPQGQYAWGMTIDLNSCIGCKGCTIACQAENNIPVVGEAEVRRGREMHWIRVDRYYAGSPDAPSTHHQPVPCMHCEHAPCEVVCPVGATVHDEEGLNVQVYNRCVGTRFCSNNCPYKVRRFNFLQYSDLSEPTLAAQRNPDVTVRNPGVMEKCTYCIQRIETAHIAADRESRAIADGEVVTACQAACPTQAITFGNLLDGDSEVSRAKASPLNYDLLEEYNTRPRTSYLAQVRNPHPDLRRDGEETS